MNWILINIGCIECGVSSQLVGVFDDYDEAKIMADKLTENYSWREGGENRYLIFSLKDGLHVKKEYLDAIGME